MLLGIVSGLMAGALWGLTFVAPLAVMPFSAIDLAVARYLIFGLTSLLLMLHPAFRPRGITRAQFLTALMLGITGYVSYYICAAYAVQLAGSAIPPLIIGALPVLLAIIGNWSDRDVPWGRLALPVSLIALGIGIVNGAALMEIQSLASLSRLLLGVGCALAALLIWIVYAVLNARTMRGKNAPGSLPWTGLQGIGAGLGVLPLIPLSWLTETSALPHYALHSTEAIRFWIWAAVLGIAGSWLATWFWIVASKRLPLALSAQLIVTETAFALIYGFTYAHRLPSAAEWIGIGVQLIGVTMAVALFTRKKQKAREVVPDGVTPAAEAPAV